jgi:RND family efflux transporter MFP subunit
VSRLFQGGGWRPAFALSLALLLMLLPAGCASDSEGSEETPADGDAAQTAADAANGDDKDKKKESDADKAEGGEEEKKKKKKKPRKERPTSVTAAPVIQGELVVPVVAEGSVRARNAADVNFEISGRVTNVWVREGQRVRKGQKLVSLDDREYVLALEEAESRYLQALGQLAVEEEGYDQESAERQLSEQRAELAQLESDGTITRDERLDRELELGMEAVRDGAYRRELLEVRSGLAAARGDATRARLDIERTVLVAPFSGVITGLELNPGERVQAGQALCRLVDDVNIEAAVGVLESDLGSVRVGRKALLSIPALADMLPVKVDVVSPDVDEDSRTCKVLMRFRSRDGRVKPGMFVRAAIAGEVHTDKLLVPREAILTRDGRPVIFKVEGDRALWVYVQLGERNDHLVEIKRIDQGGPLDPGTLVVVDNHLTLTHNAKIKVKKEVEVRDPWAEAAEKS